MNWTRDDQSVRSRFRCAVRLAGVPDGQPLVVAVSGGGDSLALLDLVAREAGTRRWHPHVVHLDHGWRPDSGDDGAFVRERARRLGLPSTGFSIRLPAGGVPSEAGARSGRRQALLRVARRLGTRTVFLGHTRDDQAETICLHLLRGTGIRGLVGMAPRRGIWVRPLLAVGRAELRAYLDRRGLAWREDPTNVDPRYLRNRIRARLLPFLETEIRSGSTEALLRMAEALRSLERKERHAAAVAWERLAPTIGPSAIRLDRPALATYDPALVERILQRAFRRVGRSGVHLAQTHLRALGRAVHDPAPRQFDLPSGVRAFVNAREVHMVASAIDPATPNPVREPDANPVQRGPR